MSTPQELSTILQSLAGKTIANVKVLMADEGTEFEEIHTIKITTTEGQTITVAPTKGALLEVDAT